MRRSKLGVFLLVCVLCFSYSQLSAADTTFQEEHVPAQTLEDENTQEGENVQEGEETKESPIVSMQPFAVPANGELTGITLSPSNRIELNEEVTIQADVSGAMDELQFKVVWQKDNWKSWDILQVFDNNSVVKWRPKEVGNYTIYIDARNKVGEVVTKTANYVVQYPTWDFQGVQSDISEVQKVGSPVRISAPTSGNTAGLQYKFVWEKDNWKTWGVIRNFAGDNFVDFTANTPGKYTFYVDVRGIDGKVQTKTLPFIYRTSLWKFDSFSTNLPSPQDNYVGTINLGANTSGENGALQYKFVWQKDNWKTWGVLRAFDASNQYAWTPKEIGDYTLYVDVKDVDGTVETFTIPYRITKVNWSFDAIDITPRDVQKQGEAITIEAKTSGNITGLRYKFLWMRDNWKEWGIISDPSLSNTATWNLPNKTGQYTIIVDVIDRDGEARTKSMPIFSASQIWSYDSIIVNGGAPQQIYRNIPVQANVTGETQNLQYKFVWMKNNWAQWGILNAFSSQNQVNWYPKEAGTYTIICDIKSPDGRVVTKQIDYTVSEAPWKVDSISAVGGSSFFPGSNTTVSVNVSGLTSGLQYKFVQKNGENWNDWEVLQDFSSSNTVPVSIKKAGNSYIYVDIKDQEGQAFDAKILTLRGCDFQGVGVTTQQLALGSTIDVWPRILGTSPDSPITYKYVWQKDGWKDWGVFKEASATTNVPFKPTSEGNYTFIIDATLNGVTQTKSIAVKVAPQKNGWYYENGYKFYYQNDKKVEDVRSIIGWQSSYEIRVNKQQSVITVYARDGANGYIIPVVAFACSPGNATPLGTFYTPEKYRWHQLFGATGQWCTRIKPNILFHSVPYRSFDNHTMMPGAYNKLGTIASAGCIRLRAGDAKWIYDNCPLKTKVTIFNSSSQGPFSKPYYAPIPHNQGWDPTDPYR